MIFYWVWKKTGFPYLQETETKSTTLPKKKEKVSSGKRKKSTKR